MSANEQHPFITVSVGTCNIKYSQDPDVFSTDISTVNITCPNVTLLTIFNKCQMTITDKDKNNAKLNNRTVTVTEPQDGTKIQVMHNFNGDITNVEIYHPKYRSYISSRYWEDNNGYRFTHNLRENKYGLTTGLGGMWSMKQFNELMRYGDLDIIFAHKYGLKQEK